MLYGRCGRLRGLGGGRHAVLQVRQAQGAGAQGAGGGRHAVWGGGEDVNPKPCAPNDLKP